jgi:plastocyanin
MKLQRIRKSTHRAWWVVGVVCCLTAIGFMGTDALAGGATLRGKLSYEGPPPGKKPLEVDHDMDCCAKKPIMPETLLVDTEGGVRDAVVWLEGVEGDRPWPGDGAVMDQEGCIFLPHVVVLGVGQTMRFLNSDPIIHNIHTWPRENSPMSVSQLAKGLGRPIKRKFDTPDEIKVTCDVHKWMGAWIIVRDNSYYALTGGDGVFEIPDIPPGTYKMVIWHESLDRVEKQVEFDADGTHVENVEMTLK